MEEGGKRLRPQLMVVEALEDDYNLISTDLLSAMKSTVRMNE